MEGLGEVFVSRFESPSHGGVRGGLEVGGAGVNLCT